MKFELGQSSVFQQRANHLGLLQHILRRHVRFNAAKGKIVDTGTSFLKLEPNETAYMDCLLWHQVEMRYESCVYWILEVS
jgi:hypothetical protein